MMSGAEDPLASFRERFRLPDGMIYLDGNSLGALPAATPARLDGVVRREWGESLVAGWNAHAWIDAPTRVGDKIARLIGAGPGEVLVADSTSVNLFKLIAAACLARPERTTILGEPGDFPTDLYVAQGVARMMRRRVRTVPPDDLAAAIDDDVAVVVLTHVHYKSGRLLDLATLTAAAQAAGALIVWDLSHSAGAVPVDLGGAHADLAVGCGYKYLNGGPGAPAFLYVRRDLQPLLESPLSGWMGHAEPFAFEDAYRPAAGIGRFLCGTPPILAVASLESGVDLMLGADFASIVAKSRALSGRFIAGLEERCAGHGLTLISPRDPAARGSHVSFTHPQAFAICQALIERGVIGDFRSPDAIRFGFTPLYLSAADIDRAIMILAEVMRQRSWDEDRHRRQGKVT